MAFSFNGIPIGGNPLRAKRSGTSLGTAIFLVVFGIVFLSVAYAIYSSTKIDANWERTDGKVVSIEEGRSSKGGTTYSPIVEYSVNGQAYTVESSISSSSRPSVGEVRSVGYDPKNPSDARLDEGATGLLFPGVFAGFGLFALLIGPVLYIRSRRRTAAINNLIQSGQKVTGVVTNIGATTMNSNNRSATVEVSAADLSGTVRQFVSDPLTGLGPLAMMDFQTNPIPVDVYIDPTNPDNYYVDISDLPNLTPERIKELIGSRLSGGNSATQPINNFEQPPTETPPAAPGGSTTPPHF